MIGRVAKRLWIAFFVAPSLENDTKVTATLARLLAATAAERKPLLVPKMLGPGGS